MVQPNEKCNLDDKVKGNEFSQEPGNTFGNGKEGVYHPIREPLRVISSIGRVNCLEGHVCGVDEGYEVGDESASSKHVKDRSNDGACKGEEVNLGVSSLFL